MKKLFGLFILALIVGACEEVGPTITLQQTDRKVLVEEFTGVKCVNCPIGSAKLEELLEIHGDKMIAISIHSGIFSSPYAESKYDFRTPDGNELESYLGPPSGYPSAVINRRWYSGQQERVVYLNDWPGFVSGELQRAPVVRIDLENTYDENTRQLNVAVDLYFFEEIVGQTNVSVLITESGVEDYQLTPDGKQADYKHKHILRDVITPSHTGESLGTQIAADTPIAKNYTYTIPAEWKADKCKIVVFVNKNEGNDLEVLQAEEASVMN